MPLAGIERELCTLAGQIAAANCRFLYLLADFDARRGWAGSHMLSCAHWLSWRCGLDLRTAREHLRVARSLAVLPHLRAVFAAGRVSYSKVRAIVRVGTPENEAGLVDAALHSTAAQLERVTRGLRSVSRDSEPDESGSGEPGSGEPGSGEPGSGEPGSDQQSSDAGEDQLSGRAGPPRYGVHAYFDDDGVFVIRGRLAAEDGARVLAGLVRAERERLRTRDDRFGGEGEPPVRQHEPRHRAEPDGHAGSGRQAGSGSQAGSDGQGSQGGAAAFPHDGPEPRARAASSVVARPPAGLGPALVAMAEMVCAAVDAPIHAPAAEVIVNVDIDDLLDAFDLPHPTAGDDRSGSGSGPGTVPRREPARPTGENEPENHISDHPVRGESRARHGSGTGARLNDGPALYPATLRRLADDGRLRTAVVAGDGRTVNLGRSSRTVSARQLLTLWRRDGGCAVPGCGRVRFLHAHHVVFWSVGGPTDLDNLMLLCSEHHRALHDGRFSVRAHGEQRFTFHAPDGDVYQAVPGMAGDLDALVRMNPRISPETIVPDLGADPSGEAASRPGEPVGRGGRPVGHPGGAASPTTGGGGPSDGESSLPGLDGVTC